MRRREFLSLLMASSSSACATPVQTDSWLFPESDKAGFPILQGLTDETSTQFSIVLPRDQRWKIEIDDLLDTQVEIFGREFSPYQVYKIYVSGLILSKTYILKIRDEHGKVADQREFSALDLSHRPVKLGFLSCALDLLHRDDIWLKLEEQKAELLFFLGDNVYADRRSWLSKKPANPQQIWERYIETRLRLAFYYQRRLTPVLAIWDDHDFGGDNMGGAFAFKEESRIIFETFFAQSERDNLLLRGPGIAKRFTAFGADFFLLDGRSFRDTSGDKNARLLGLQQEEWLFAHVRPKASFLLNGSMFFGAYTHKDAFEGQFANNFPEFLRHLRQTEGLFCFASGDVHFSELQAIEESQLGYPTFELTSSSIHSMAVPGHQLRWSNPRRRAATGSHNFCIFEGSFSDDRIEGEITSYSAKSEEFRVKVNTHR